MCVVLVHFSYLSTSLESCHSLYDLHKSQRGEIFVFALLVDSISADSQTVRILGQTGQSSALVLVVAKMPDLRQIRCKLNGST